MARHTHSRLDCRLCTISPPHNGPATRIGTMSILVEDETTLTSKWTSSSPLAWVPMGKETLHCVRSLLSPPAPMRLQHTTVQIHHHRPPKGHHCPPQSLPRTVKQMHKKEDVLRRIKQHMQFFLILLEPHRPSRTTFTPSLLGQRQTPFPVEALPRIWEATMRSYFQG